MIFLNAAGDSFGRSAELGSQMGEHLIKCGFVETYQRMWQQHFNETMFNSDEVDQTLLYNMLVSLQVTLLSTRPIPLNTGKRTVNLIRFM